VEGVLIIIHRHDLFYTVTALRTWRLGLVLPLFESFETLGWFEPRANLK
jgi:hypothetical protein